MPTTNELNAEDALFIFESCVRLNDRRAVERNDREMLDEELTEIEAAANRIRERCEGEK